jgi:hypothetical protein
MDKKIRKVQMGILEVFSKKAKNFALSGGTALELYYLHHRFSADLDFFSPRYDPGEIDKLVLAFRETTKTKIKLESEFLANACARVRFYTIPIKGSDRSLKIDFVEDVLFGKPQIKKFKGVPVYSIENIYLQKIVAIAGAQLQIDEVGRIVARGSRREARDVFDIYILSKKICPLHIFIRKQSSQIQRGVVHWYRTFSRQDLKLALLDLDIYDKKFDIREMIIYLEKEIERFIKEVLE